MGLPGLFSYILMVSFAAGPALSEQTVRGVVGQSVTLPCTYSVHDGVTSMCWGRGWCPLTKCSNEIIWTDGHKMTFQHSNRYNLNENLSEGIVSLTIENLTEADAGLYCCRVEFSGWFNDQKVTVKLMIDQATTVTALTTPASTHPTLTTLTSFASTHPMLTTTKDQSSGNIPIMFYGQKIFGERHSVQKQCTDHILKCSELKRDFQLGSLGGLYFWMTSLSHHILIHHLLFCFCSLTFLAGSRNEAERSVPEDGSYAEGNVYTIEDNVYIVEDNIYMIEEENEYVVPTCNEKKEPSKI
ncbi:uncharacterized protein LOC141502350 [Macrotis lagotis]|uniref:uncharacterized protein LOC141502350 n=1 Tax=Macrotis lagotis TaxID=92651 RepID=UPI003D689D77